MVNYKISISSISLSHSWNKVTINEDLWIESNKIFVQIGMISSITESFKQEKNLKKVYYTAALSEDE